MRCEDANLHELLLKNCTIKCLTFEEKLKQPYNDTLCIFRALALDLHGNYRLDDETSKHFSLFINRVDGLNPNQFQWGHMKDNPFVDDLLTLKLLQYDIGFADGITLGELARRSVLKHWNTVRLSRYNNRICYVSYIIEAFQYFRCAICDILFNKTSNFEQFLTS